ncbi:hypothetical protein SLS58_004293 [Diplodia intermedia]|uniref:Myb/SANT-like domain-containing protein n=1 Tax=Diplodia intermedia TaxID=856260 RepID=A0ABR3TTR7_9PEZI
MPSTTPESKRHHESCLPWTLQAVEAMLDGLIVAEKRRLTVDGGFKDAGWQLAVDAVQKLMPNTPVRKEHIASKLRGYKDLYAGFKDFENGGGRRGRWGFDMHFGTWFAADEAVANDYYAAHPEHQAFRHEGPGGPALFWRLDRLLSDGQATGRWAVSIEDAVDPNSPYNRGNRMHREARLRKRRLQRAAEEDVGDLPGASSSPASASSPPQRKRARRDEPRVRGVVNAVDTLNQRLDARNEVLRRVNQTAVTPIARAMRIIQNEFDLTMEALMFFCQIFEDVEMARVFCRLYRREDQRLWLERQLALKPDGERIMLEKAS